jgi:hypothetical protein
MATRRLKVRQIYREVHPAAVGCGEEHAAADVPVEEEAGDDEDGTPTPGVPPLKTD